MGPVGCVERCAGKEGVIVRVIGLIVTPACCTFRRTEGSEVFWVKSVKASFIMLTAALIKDVKIYSVQCLN